MCTARRVFVGVALAAGLAAQAAPAAPGWLCAGPGTGVEHGLRYSPAPASLLVSNPALPFGMAQAPGRAGGTAAVLAHTPVHGPPVPVAQVSLVGDGGLARICVNGHTQPDTGAQPVELRLATLERLYALVLTHDAYAAYCLADRQQRCSRRGSLSQGEALRRLAQQREALAARAAGGATPPRWQGVSLSAAGARHADEDMVSARITDGRGPMAGVALFFNRAPHSSCVGTSLPNGVATCRLVDQHGDDDAHAHEEHAPVLVTFPGQVGALRTLLPTTLVMRRAP